MNESMTEDPARAASPALYIAKIELPKARLFRREPYIVAVTVGAEGVAGKRREVEVRTAPARGIKAGRPWIPDDPIELFPAGEARGLIATSVRIMESDRDFRRVAQTVAGVRDRLRTTSLGRRVAAGIGFSSAGVAEASLERAADLVVGALRNAGDDLLGQFSGELTNANDYRRGESWEVEAGKAVVTLGSGSFETDAPSAPSERVSGSPRFPKPDWSDFEKNETDADDEDAESE